jgi:alanyl-tRNA synthetase
MTLQPVLGSCSMVGANNNSIENTVKKLKNENEILMKNAKLYSRKNLENIKPYTPEGNKITIFQGVFSDFIDSEIRAFADKKIVNNDTFVIIANAHNNDNDLSNSTATLIVARSESLKDIDCNRIVKEIASMDGKGGGKPHFATGLIKSVQAANVVNTIVTLITK